MKRRSLIAAALASPNALLIGCAAPVRSVGAADQPATMRVTVLNDAFGRDASMQKDWGYAAFLEIAGRRILFDTGNNGDVLARNAAAKDVDLSRLDFVVMSHRHGDHMGGMSQVLRVNPKVRIYAPKEGFGVYGGDLPSTFYRKDESLPTDQRYYDGRPPETMRFGSAWPQANVTLIDKTTMVSPGIHLISLVSDKPGTLELRELSLAVETPEGMVVVVGCSHTGLDNVVKAAAAIQPRIHFVTGGFHLVVAKDADIDVFVRMLHDTYNVAYVAPGHCTGEPTFTALRRAFGERYIYAGLGSTIDVGATPRSMATHQRPGSSWDEQDQLAYAKLLERSSHRRRQLFASMTVRDMPGGGYLGEWARSRIGCC